MLRPLLVSVLFSSALIAESIGDRIGRLAADRQFSGAVLIAQGETIRHSSAYGQASRTWNLPNTPATRFSIASITKTFTAVAVLQLIEQGRCRLDDRIAQYVPGLPDTWREITVEQLLRHRSGIPSHRSLSEYRKTITQPYTASELIAEYFDVPLAFQPGTRFQYSNPGYHILAILLENVSGEKRLAYLQRHIFAPAAMKDTGVEQFQDVIPNLAEGYERDEGRVVRARYWDRSIAFGTGDMYSTVGDLLRYQLALSSGKLLGTKFLEAMYRPVDGSMGMGWFVRSPVPGVMYYEHTGGNPGFASLVRRYPADDLVIVILSNFEDTDTTGLADQLARMLRP